MCTVVSWFLASMMAASSSRTYWPRFISNSLYFYAKRDFVRHLVHGNEKSCISQVRRNALIAADILEEIKQEGNVGINEDVEDGNQFQHDLGDTDISSTQRPAFASSKKRKAHETGEVISEDLFIKFATLLGDKISELGKKLSKNIGSEMVIQQRVQELYGALGEIDDLTEDEIPNQPTQMLVFFSLLFSRKLGWVRRFLANN